MKSITFTICFAVLLSLIGSKNVQAQYPHPQYFDGDSLDSLRYYIDSTIINTWQVGPPQKVIFDSAASFPNAMITDTVQFYPKNDSSVFYLTINHGWLSVIYALQWKQKLDMEYGKDGGRIEYRSQSDTVWRSVFDNPYIYKFYGYDAQNVAPLQGRDSVFTGTDSTWKDIWLCFDFNFFYEDVFLRFTIISDSTDTKQEGWMIDNMIGHLTFVHTVKEEASTEYLKVFPTLTEGRVHIQAEKRTDYHIIEHMELYNANGQLVKNWGRTPTKFFIDIGELDDGMYILKVTTNIKTESHRIQLKHN